jgi:Na+/H+ antiporter NhaD/arsenite permease-like protein
MFLFILVGNLGRIQALDDALTSIVSGNELMVSVAASQIISNAPASILLSGFTDEYFLLALGTDLGGLGTLIASMANLISFKKYTEVKNSSPLRYILGFTLINLLFLVPMLIAAGLLTS